MRRGSQTLAKHCSVVSGPQGKPLSLGRELAAYPKRKGCGHCLPLWEVAGNNGGLELGVDIEDRERGDRRARGLHTE